jgi:predicted nucleic acid-binding OB-fold protein
MINTQEEKDANINLITSFIETARTELTDVIEKLISAKESEYTHYIQEEIVDPNTGDVKV